MADDLRNRGLRVADFIATTRNDPERGPAVALNEREARSHPRRNVLQKSLGAGNQFVDPQLGAVAFEQGDRFLLCTDGITDGLYDQQLAELLRTPSAAEIEMNPAQRLVRHALNYSGRDNTTALVIEAH